jgi:hypothetical protein
MPDALSARPMPLSVPYDWAVSMCRYPTSRASATIAVVVSTLAGEVRRSGWIIRVPNPT